MRGRAIGYIPPRKKLVHFKGRYIRAIPLLRKPRTIIVALLLAMSIGGLGAAQAALCPDANGAICKLSAGSYFTMAVTVVALLLMCNDAPPDLVLVGTTTLLLLTHVITDEEALKGFCSPSVLAIGALFPVARSLEEAQTVDRAIRPILGHPTSHRAALLRLCAPVAIFSGFLNNTPLVAMLISPCETWAANSGLHISVLLMPLSFSSMLGGMCTLIGTSTNLVLNSQIEQDPSAPLQPFGMFSMTPVSLPAAILGIGVMALLAPPLLSRDTLLLEVSTIFAEMYRHSGTFALLNEVHGSRKCAPSAARVYGRKQRWVAILSLVVLLVLSSTELVPLLPLTLSLSFVLVGAGCITVEQAWASISYRVLITIAASFGLGSALKNTHISNLLADALISLSGSVPHVTNLLVVGRGGYRFGDFTRLGGILTLVVGVCVSVLAWGLPASVLP
ncbi:hypothetical protein AB1Y20_022866 [Prymnesium parvum]|uniref:Citrate transporter-like domain-containing protein n=1 Tax=Prymnesium parvum TaxID=97485 RepID=A0AB34JEM2_PRYPA